MTEEETHETAQRLLESAMLATRGSRDEVTSWASLARAMGTTPQAVNHWKKRGVSEPAALAAGRLFGCSPLYILDGTMERPVARYGRAQAIDPAHRRLLMLYDAADAEGKADILAHAHGAAVRALGLIELSNLESASERAVTEGVQMLSERRDAEERRPSELGHPGAGKRRLKHGRTP